MDDGPGDHRWPPVVGPDVAPDVGTDVGPDVVDEVSRGVRALRAGPERADRHVVVLPGMGALGYLLPVVRALASRGERVSLLDLPGFGREDGLGCPPTVRGVAEAAARWCAGLPPHEQVVVVGHSTGAVSALLTARLLEDSGRPPGAVVLASPVAAPGQRSLARILARVPLAYRRDSTRDLRVLGDFRRAGRDALTLLRSALAERLGRSIRGLQSPVLVTAGRSDAFVPPAWLVSLAQAAPTRLARVVRLPGSHNNPSTHPEAVAATITELADEAAARRRRRPRPNPPAPPAPGGARRPRGARPVGREGTKAG